MAADLAPVEGFEGFRASDAKLALGVAPLQAGSDGTVGLDETRLPGLHDHCVVQASHSGLLRSPAAAQQVLAFLRGFAVAPGTTL